MNDQSTRSSRTAARGSSPFRLAPIMAAIALAGCGGGAGLGSPGPGGLAYGVPTSNPASYAFADTARFAIESGTMGTMRMVGIQEGRATLEFRQGNGGFEVVVSFPRLDASFATPAQGEERADQSDLGGPLLVGLSPAGRVTVVDTPAIGPALAGMAGPDALVRPFFVSLPARPVRVGASWVDTVRTVEETGGTVSTSTSVITTTLVGDTVVADRTVLVLRTVSENVVEVSGSSGGVDIQQRLSGTTRGQVLWDPGLGLLLERREEGQLTGTLDMPGMDVQGLPVNGTVTRVVVLQP